MAFIRQSVKKGPKISHILQHSLSVWLISICLTCIIAHDNAKLHTIQKKYVLLREFARQNKEWADKADLIEYLYTDEAEHQEEIQRLWENRHKRLERRETKSIGHP